ncbi:MAG: hypothetical protein ACTTJI_03815 [Capnocytophaga sp.]|uniref:hypothetical protein n=1 Tax=Capnocytophaga sp. TaxID=44737 RepID=UPI003FA126DC
MQNIICNFALTKTLNIMPATVKSKTKISSPKVISKSLGAATPKKKATVKKKINIEELGERAQKIAKKYNMKPFERTNFYATNGNM